MFISLYLLKLYIEMALKLLFKKEMALKLLKLYIQILTFGQLPAALLNWRAMGIPPYWKKCFGFFFYKKVQGFKDWLGSDCPIDPHWFGWSCEEDQDLVIGPKPIGSDRSGPIQSDPAHHNGEGPMGGQFNIWSRVVSLFTALVELGGDSLGRDCNYGWSAVHCSTMEGSNWGIHLHPWRSNIICLAEKFDGWGLPGHWGLKDLLIIVMDRGTS